MTRISRLVNTLIVPHRLSARGLGPMEPPDQRPDETDGRGPGSDHHHAHQRENHLERVFQHCCMIFFRFYIKDIYLDDPQC